jgi:hypothetical protein
MSWPPSAEDFENYVAQRNSRKPEQHVLDDIEALVNEELTHTPDDYHRNNERYVKCELCQGLWHGLPAHNGCPGAYATEEQVAAWVESPTDTGEYLGPGTGEYLGHVMTEYQGVLCSVHLYRDELRGFVGLLTPTDERPGFDCDLYTFDEALSTFTVFPEGIEMPVMVVPQLFSGDRPELDTP